MIWFFPITRAALAQMRTGERGDAYRWSVIQCGHVWIGCAGSTLTGSWQTAPVAALTAVVLYRVIWECLIQRGGDRVDSVADTAFIALGFWYGGPILLPWSLAASLVAGLEMGLSDTKRKE